MSISILLEFLDEAKHCQTQEALIAVFQRIMDKIGFRRWAHVIRERGSDPLIVHTYPEDWVNYYKQQRYWELDPVAVAGLTRVSPFRWSELIRPDNTTVRQQAYLREAADFGLVDGLGVPIASLTENNLFSMASDENVRCIEARLKKDAPTYLLLAMSFNTLLKDILTASHADAPEVVSPLSPRERECLLWVMRGKTSWEVAKIINTTERTVNFHIENAKKKLGVHSRSEAVATAVARGYLRP